MSTSLTKTQELELLAALDSRAESPLKFAYVGSGYKNWIQFAERSRKDHAVQFEEELLKKESLPFLFREINNKTDTVNIVDFGCGDGVPMLSVVAYLQDREISTIRYIPVDISKKMLAEAEKTVKSKFKNLEIVAVLSDFEKGEILEDILRFAGARNTSNYFFLLGNTLGNFHNTEQILSNLRLSMFPSDHFVIGNQISNLLAAQKLIKYYHTKEAYNLTTSTLKDYGMKSDFKELAVRWNAGQKQIEVLLSVAENKKVAIAGHTVSFEKGEEILLAVSKKFAEESIVEVLNRVGFRIDLFTTNKQKDTCIISVTPSRYKSS